MLPPPRSTEALKTADRLIAAFGPNPVRSDACLALARLYRLVGNDPDELRLIERAFILEPTRFEAARAWLIQLCGMGADERAKELLTRLATDPAGPESHSGSSSVRLFHPCQLPLPPKY